MGRTRRLAAAALAAALALGTAACDAPAQPLVIIDTVAGNGVGGFSGDGGPASEAQINRPYGVAVDSSGALYIADTVGNRIRKVDPSGSMSTVAGNGVLGFSGDGADATAAQLFNPKAVAVDATGNLYIADMGNHRIRRVDTSGVITTIAGSGDTGFSGDGGPAVEAALPYPADVSVDGAGNLYVADQLNDRIRKVDTSGIITTVAGAGGTGFSGDGGPATDAQLNRPEGVVADDAGNLYIADTLNNRVRKVDAAGVITTVAGTGLGAYFGDGGPATDAFLSAPSDVALFPDGSVLIADRDNHAVRVLFTNGVIGTVAGYSAAQGWPPDQGFAGDGDVPSKAKFYFPRGVAVDASGAMYVADERNSRIRKIWPGGGAINGRVVADDGLVGIGGLTVNIYADSDLENPVATGSTSAQGYFGFSLVTGSYRIEVEGGDGYAGEWFDDAPDGSSAAPVVVGEGAQQNVDIALAG